MGIPINRFTLTLCTGFVLAASPIRAGEAPAEDDFKINGDIKKGGQTYQMMCIACHGEKGDGKGPAAVALNPPPGNFTDRERMAKNTDKYLFTIIKEGGAVVGKSPLMVPWKAALNDEKVQDVAAYIKTFSQPKAE